MGNYLSANVDPNQYQSDSLNRLAGSVAYKDRRGDIARANAMANRQFDAEQRNNALNQDRMNRQENRLLDQSQRGADQSEMQLMGVQADVIGKALDNVRDPQSYQAFQGWMRQIGQTPLGQSQFFQSLLQRMPQGYDQRLVEEAKKNMGTVVVESQKPQGGFTLNPGQTRFDSSGQQIARGADARGKQIERTVDLGDKVEFIYSDGTTKSKPKGASPNSSQNAPDSMASTLANQVIEGRLDPNMISKRGGLQQKVFSMVEQIAPGFNIIGANANAKYATNSANLQSRALIEGVEPLYDQLMKAGKDLGNSSIPGVNRIVNWAKLETGDPKITAFNNLRDDVVAETERILLGSGVLSDSKYQRALKNVNSAQSSEQLGAAVKQLRFVVKSRLKALNSKPYQNMQQPQRAESQQPPAVHGAKQAPDGNWYVQRNGQYFRIEQ